MLRSVMLDRLRKKPDGVIFKSWRDERPDTRADFRNANVILAEKVAGFLRSAWYDDEEQHLFFLNVLPLIHTHTHTVKYMFYISFQTKPIFSTFRSETGACAFHVQEKQTFFLWKKWVSPFFWYDKCSRRQNTTFCGLAWSVKRFASLEQYEELCFFFFFPPLPNTCPLRQLVNRTDSYFLVETFWHEYVNLLPTTLHTGPFCSLRKFKEGPKDSVSQLEGSPGMRCSEWHQHTLSHHHNQYSRPSHITHRQIFLRLAAQGCTHHLASAHCRQRSNVVTTSFFCPCGRPTAPPPFPLEFTGNMTSSSQVL